jgi:hypothetical protein
VSELYVLDFAKSSILTSLSDVHNRNVLLIATDRIIAYDGINEGANGIGMDPNNWASIRVIYN